MDNHRHYRNRHVVDWLRVLSQHGGSALLSVKDVQRLKLYHLGALWAQDRGYVKNYGTADVISHEYRRFAYSLTDKGKAICKKLTHDYHYDHHRAGMLCRKCGRFVSDYL